MPADPAAVEFEIDAPALPTVRSVDLVIPDDEVGPPVRPGLRPIPHQQEEARRWLALTLVGFLGVEILFAVVVLWLPQLLSIQAIDVNNVKEIMLIVFGPTVALVGSATGFYFGSKPDAAPSNTPPRDS